MLCAASTAKSRLGRSEARDRHAVRRAGDVVESDLVAELDGRRIAAVLAADSAVELRAGRLAVRDGHLHELADAGLVELRERIVLVDLLVVVRAEELAGVVAAEAKNKAIIAAEASKIAP